MSKIISFSVWGDKPLYLNGSLENIEIAKEVYPGWITRFYCDSGTPESFRNDLEKAGAEVVVMTTITSHWEGLFWRFFPASEPDVDVFISRDIDSRINYREQAAVEEWLESGKLLHCMRDHIEHNVPILGGMWGCKRNLIPSIRESISRWGKFDYKGCDQDFLRKVIWESYRAEAMVHDRFYKGYIEQKTEKKTKEEILLLEQELQTRKEQMNNPDIPPLVFNDNGELVISEYIYDPLVFFGAHDIRPFPKHKSMKYGTHVGEIIQ